MTTQPLTRGSPKYLGDFPNLAAVAMSHIISLALVLMLVAGFAASPVNRENDAEELGIMERFLHDFSRSYQGAHVRVRRQAACTDMNISTCLLNSTISPSSDLVDCDNMSCVCNDCFYRNSQGFCTYCSDYPYDSRTGMCGTDNRPTQIAAILLSVFLSPFGAANFYIGQTALGAGQVALTLILLISCYLLCCPCILCCCVDKDVKGACWFLILIVVVIVLIVACTLGTIAWWIGDIAIFGRNERLSGDGCVLRPI